MAVVDSHWATAGLSNLDPFSLLLAREANVVIENAAFAGQLADCLQHALTTQGRRVDSADYAGRAWFDCCNGWLACGLMRLGVTLTDSRY